MDIFITVANSINNNTFAGIKTPYSTKISKLLYIPQISKIHYLPKISRIYDDEINNYLSNNGAIWKSQLIIYTYLCNLLKSCATLINTERALIGQLLCKSSARKFLKLAKLIYWEDISYILLYEIILCKIDTYIITQDEFTNTLLDIISPDVMLIKYILEHRSYNIIITDALHNYTKGELFMNSLRGRWITACITFIYINKS